MQTDTAGINWETTNENCPVGFAQVTLRVEPV